MAVQKLSHIGLCVSDIKKSEHFYKTVFGYENCGELHVGKEADTLLDLENTDLEVVYLKRPHEDTRIELLHFRSPETEKSTKVRPINLTGITHFSFRVDNMQEILALVKKHGGQLIESTFSENKNSGVASCMVTDPDGTRIELLLAPADPHLLSEKNLTKK